MYQDVIIMIIAEQRRGEGNSLCWGKILYTIEIYYTILYYLILIQAGLFQVKISI